MFTKKYVEDRIVFMRQNRLYDICAKKVTPPNFVFRLQHVRLLIVLTSTIVYREVEANSILENVVVAPSNN